LRISARINKRNLKSPQRLGRFRGVEPYRVFKGCETLDYLVRVWGMQARRIMSAVLHGWRVSIADAMNKEHRLARAVRW